MIAMMGDEGTHNALGILNAEGGHLSILNAEGGHLGILNAEGGHKARPYSVSLHIDGIVEITVQNLSDGDNRAIRCKNPSICHLAGFEP